MSEDINKKAFSNLVETYVRTHKGCQYMDAVITVCDDNEIDLRDSKKLISNASLASMSLPNQQAGQITMKGFRIACVLEKS